MRTTATAVVGLAVLVIGGCGSTKFVTSTQTATVTNTATTTQTITHVRKISSLPPVTTTKTQTTTVTQLPMPTSAFSGNGGESLGTIHVGSDSTVQWTNDGGIFQLSDPGDNIFVNSQGRSGTSQVSAGTYQNVTVNADGNWTIHIVPNQ